MSEQHLLPPEFDLPARTRLAQRRLLETAVGRGAEGSALPRPRAIALAAALALGILLVNPAFGLGQKVVEVFSSQPAPQLSPKRDAATKPRSDRASVRAPDQPAGERSASAQRGAKARRSRPPRGSGTGAGVPNEPTVPRPAPERHCQAGSREATIAGARRCLKAGQRCQRRLDRGYHRYGFHCHGARLAAAPRSADLSVVQRLPQVSQARASVGEELTRWVVVRNRGPAAAAGVVVRASLPAGAGLSSVTAYHGECESEPTGVVCRLGTIARGGTKTIGIVARVPITRRLVDTAIVSADTSDPRSANNASTRTTVVRRGFARGRGLFSVFGSNVDVVVDAVAVSGPGGETGEGTFSIRYSGEISAAFSGHIVCLNVSGKEAQVFGIVDFVSHGASLRDMSDNVISIGAGAAFWFADKGPSHARLDAAVAPYLGVDAVPRACSEASLGSASGLRAAGTVLTAGDFEIGFTTP